MNTAERRALEAINRIALGLVPKRRQPCHSWVSQNPTAATKKPRQARLGFALSVAAK